MVKAIRKPPISKEFALTYGLTIETVSEYAKRAHIAPRTARARVARSRAYGFKLGGRLYIVTKDGQDLKFIVS